MSVCLKETVNGCCFRFTFDFFYDMPYQKAPSKQFNLSVGYTTKDKFNNLSLFYFFSIVGRFVGLFMNKKAFVVYFQRHQFSWNLMLVLYFSSLWPLCWSTLTAAATPLSWTTHSTSSRSAGSTPALPSTEWRYVIIIKLAAALLASRSYVFEGVRK